MAVAVCDMVISSEMSHRVLDGRGFHRCSCGAMFRVLSACGPLVMLDKRAVHGDALCLVFLDAIHVRVVCNVPITAGTVFGNELSQVRRWLWFVTNFFAVPITWTIILLLWMH